MSISNYLESRFNIPRYSNRPINKQFLNFLSDNIEQNREYPTCSTDIEALEIHDGVITINEKKCIGCLSCITSKESFRTIDEPIKTELLNQLFTQTDTVRNIQNIDCIFTGNRIELPTYGGFQRNFFSLECFTCTDETTHIALWVTSMLKFLSSNNNPIIGTEIEIDTPNSSRPNRLDMCIRSNSNVLIFETKTNFLSMMDDERYREKIPEYAKECERQISEYFDANKVNLIFYIFLVIGGKETHLFPPSHRDCTTKIGDQSEKFYKDIIKHKIKFISANAIWILAMNGIINDRKICWDKFFPQVFNSPDVLGLLTAGVVKVNNGKYVIEPLSNEIKTSSQVLH